MNRNLRIIYRVVALARLIFVIISFILAKIYSNSLPETGLFAGGIDLHFDWWVDLLIIVIYCTFAFVILFQLTVSLSQQFTPALLQRKAIVWTVFMIELLAAGLIGKITAENIQRYFFPRPRTILDTLLSPLFPTNESTLIIGKYEAVNCSLMALCSIFFIVFMFKYRKHYLAAANTNNTDAADGQ
jgi:hypothetical protein